jgi:hypothetical protein
MDELVDIIDRYHSAWDDPCVDRAIFGTVDPAAIAAAVRSFVNRELSADIQSVLHYGSSVGTAIGLALTDGRRILVKCHRPTMPLELVDAFASFREGARKVGVAAPALVTRAWLVLGYATVEEFVDAPATPDGFAPEVRSILAEGLCELARFGATYRDRAGLPDAKLPNEGHIWRAPHSELFDLERNADGAEWIDELGRRAPLTRSGSFGELACHLDWRVEHVRVADGRIVAVFDWDSIVVTDEPRMIGMSAAHYASNWEPGLSVGAFPRRRRATHMWPRTSERADVDSRVTSWCGSA